MEPAASPLDVSAEELEALLEGVREALGEAGYQKLKAAIRTLSYVTELLENREATLETLRNCCARRVRRRPRRCSSRRAWKVAGRSGNRRQTWRPRVPRLGTVATELRRIQERAGSRCHMHRCTKGIDVPSARVAKCTRCARLAC